MAKKLVILSDKWGSKKGLWITSYLGYLQQYYDISYYDIQELANIHLEVNSDENVGKAFDEGGIVTAAAHLVKNVTEPSHFLAFGMGGVIAWKAALKGLPMKSLYAISSTRLEKESQAPTADVKLLYGECDMCKPSQQWLAQIGAKTEIVKGFGHDLYSDEKIIIKVCQELLTKITKKQFVA
ncbi:hypothetical protein [Arenibacter lacus]|uniref:hypothetical protein n=1 Tax=Arenibacter lacus TaxID=2608629 RepID=UPI00123CC983|nr:hypothetical protein [Arenibacter lacus]